MISAKNADRRPKTSKERRERSTFDIVVIKLSADYKIAYPIIQTLVSFTHFFSRIGLNQAESINHPTMSKFSSSKALQDVFGLLLILTGRVCFGFIIHKPLTISRLTVRSSISHNTESGDFPFEEMQQFDQRLKTVEEVSPDFLLSFYEPELFSFSIRPGNTTQISITSTCYSVLALLSSEPSSLSSKVKLQSVVEALLKSPFRDDDIYQVSLILHTLLKVEEAADSSYSLFSNFDKETVAQISKLISLSMTARPRRRDGGNQIFSDYISYICCSIYAALHDSMTKDKDGSLHFGNLPSHAIPEGIAPELSLALLRAGEISENELCKQMAYRTAGDSSSFDVTRLAYSLLSYIRASTSLQGTAGREIVIGEGPTAGTESVKKNMWLVKAALTAFFEEQQDDGLWDRGQPIYKSFQRKRNIGNAYVFAVDTLGSLLELLPAEYFRPYVRELQKTLEWIEARQQVEIIPDYCDSESGQCYGKALRGWSSPHLTPKCGPQAWSTAQTIACVSRLRKTIRQLMHNDILKEFNGIRHSEKGPLPQAWDRLLDSDLGSRSDQCQTIKCVLDNRVCTPFENSVSNPSVGAAYSLILFGSPGR